MKTNLKRQLKGLIKSEDNLVNAIGFFVLGALLLVAGAMTGMAFLGLVGGGCIILGLERLVRRMVHQGYRNGAENVLVQAPESVGLVDGAQYGLYRLWKTEDGKWKTEYVGK